MPSQEENITPLQKWLSNHLFLAFAGGITLYLVLGACLWWILHLYIDPANAQYPSTAKKDLFQALGLIMAGGAGVVGIYFTWLGLHQTRESTQKTLRLTAQGQITERFTHAIDQLGKTNDKDERIEEIRLGGIYALERIAVEQPDDYHWPVTQVLAAYLRRYASWQGDPSKEIAPAADTTTVLNVIGSRSRYYKAGENEQLMLHRTDFSNYHFPMGAHLEGAVLVESHFENATLAEAQLKEADLRAAHLEGAYLDGADLSNADLRGAHLEGAYLWGADLTGADLRDAYLTATYLPGAKLQEVKIRDPKNLEEANGDLSTELSGETPRPKWWGYLPPDDNPFVPGGYSIKVGKTLLYFGYLGEVWYSSLFLPYRFTISPAGVTIVGGSSITFYSGPSVVDPQKPKEKLALKEAPKVTDDWVTWFETHPHLRLTGPPDRWEAPSGYATGKQFYVEVDPGTPDDKIPMGLGGRPYVPVLPGYPRFTSYGFTKGGEGRAESLS